MTNDTETTIERLTVLHGHTSPDTALVVHNQPYRFSQTCTKRFWVQDSTSTKGPAKGKQRVIAQTTDPTQEGEVWNKERPETFALIALLCEDDAGTVRTVQIHEMDVHGVEHYRNQLNGVYDQLDDEQRRKYDAAAAALKARGNGALYHYDEWVLAHVMNHIHDTGENPRHVDGTWFRPEGALNLGFRDQPGVYFAYARFLLAR